MQKENLFSFRYSPDFSQLWRRKERLLLNLDVALHVVANLGEIGFHALGILLVDDFQEFFQLGANLADLVVGIGVEQDFLQQIVVLIEHALGYLHVTLEGGTWGVLMLHDSCKDEGRYEWNTQ